MDTAKTVLTQVKFIGFAGSKKLCIMPNPEIIAAFKELKELSGVSDFKTPNSNDNCLSLTYDPQMKQLIKFDNKPSNVMVKVSCYDFTSDDGKRIQGAYARLAAVMPA